MSKEVFNKIKEFAIWVALGGLVSLVPFYFNTSSAIESGKEDIIYHEDKIKHIENQLNNLEGIQLVQQERHISIERRLERIEEKLDYLIESSQNRSLPPENR